MIVIIMYAVTCMYSLGCSVVMKKCVTCRVLIDQFIPQIVCRGGKREYRILYSGNSL